MENNASNTSVYRRGADDGFWFGIYLSIMVVLCFNTLSATFIVNLIILLMALAVPPIIYFLLRRSFLADGCKSTFSALWLQGICIFFFGSLIMGLTVFVYLRFIDPAYFGTTISALIDMYGDAGVSDETLDLLVAMQKQHMYPTAAQTAVDLIWSAVFTGSLLSMILSLLIRNFTKTKPQ